MLGDLYGNEEENSMRHNERRAANSATERLIVDAAVTREVEHRREHRAKRLVVMESAIRERAYKDWEAAGRPPGDGVRFWLQAEEKLQLTDKS
jgi:hypothetical protein